MNSYKKLINNSVIFAIGRLGSKIISFLLVPLYTYYLTTAEYGTIDLLITTVSMLLPIVSSSMFDAILRFIIEDEGNIDKIISNAIIIVIIGIFISFSFFPVIVYLNLLGNINIVFFMYFILIVQIFERILAEFCRAIGKIKTFAINGMLLSFSIAALNILFLIVLKLDINGYFYSIILGNIISIIYLTVGTKVYKHIKFSLINFDIMKVLLTYSIPLIPNSLMWWLINASSRYFIRYFVGVSANGVFAVASKIPTLINIISQIFMQAWQISAIEEYNTKNKSLFYSNIFTYLSSLLFLGLSVILIVIKPAFNILFASEYYMAWRIVPFLLIGAVFSCFSSFLATNYMASKKTGGVFKTSIYGGISSLILNFILITNFGLVGASLSSMVSFLIMWLLRLIDTRKYIKMDINWNKMFNNMLIILIQIIILWINIPFRFELIFLLVLFLVITVINKDFIKIVINLFKKILDI